MRKDNPFTIPNLIAAFLLVLVAWFGFISDNGSPFL